MDVENQSNEATFFRIEGYERFFSAPDDTCTIIAHIMVIRGTGSNAITTLRDRLPLAFQTVMNRHPRMRVTTPKIDQDPYLGKVNPPVTLEQVKESLVAFVDDMDAWQSLVEQTLNGPSNRSTKLPFWLTAFTELDPFKIRLILFSDHFMSDGMSGQIVLHEVLEAAANPYMSALPEHLLRPSLYAQMRPSSLWTQLVDPFASFVFAQAMPTVINSTTILPLPRHPQVKTMTYPYPRNPMFMYYEQGTPAALKEALFKCKQNKVTLQGALMVCLAIAYNFVANKDCFKDTSKPLRIDLEMDFDMRSRVKEPFPEQHVGFNVFIDTVHYLKCEGIPLTSSFWQAAQRAKQAAENMLVQPDMTESILANYTTISATGMQKRVHSDSAGIHDVNVSNLGKYRYPTKHTISGTLDQAWHVESLHFTNGVQNIGPATIVFFASVESLSITLASKFTDEASRELLWTIKKCVDGIGTVQDGESLSSFANRMLVA